jgi:hypothetical protein
MTEDDKGSKAGLTLPGVVDKIIPAITPATGYGRPEKVQIAVEGAEPLYGEIQVDNTLHDDEGNPVCLKLGAKVEVRIEAATEATTPHKTAALQEPAK